MSSSINNIIKSSRNSQTPLLIEVPHITNLIVPRAVNKVFFIKSLIISPNSVHKTRRHRQFNTDFPRFISFFYLIIIIIHNSYIISRYRLSSSSILNIIKPGQVQEVRSNRPSSLSLPIVIINRNFS